MMSSRSVSPIVEFLGHDAGAGGPFALLGLLHQIDSQEQILRAANRRLAQIDRHRHRSTPDASEARLAVHAATSQLLDPVLRAELAQSWPPGVPLAVPKAWKPSRRTTRLTPAFIQSAKLLIAASGGWNATARKRLANFARTNRVTAIELVGALSPQRSRSVTKPEHAQQKPAIDRVHLIDPPPRGSHEWIVLYALLCIVGAALITTIVLDRGASGTPAASTTTTIVNTDQSGRVDADSKQFSFVHERVDFSHYTAIAHELDQLVSRSKTDPSTSIERFATIYPQFVDSWVSFPEQALDRSGLHIAECVRRMSESTIDSDQLWSILKYSRSNNTPSESMIGSAVIDVALSDPGLSSTTKSKLIALRKRCSGYDPRPTQSMTDSLVLIAGLQAVDARTDELTWWKDWANSVQAITMNDEEQRARLVLSALSARLRDPTPPESSWDQSVIELANMVSWREGLPSTYWLLSQFSDQAVSTPRLAALTSALAIHSGAKKIDARMVLNPSSTFPQRQELAQAYRLAWTPTKSASDTHAPVDQSVQSLINELHIRVSITPTRMDQAQALLALVELARLNTAAWQFENGDQTLAQETLKDATTPLKTLSVSSQTDLSFHQHDIAWAESAINVASSVELSELFARLVQNDGPRVNSAHALVYLATLHADRDIRSLARVQLVRYKQNPSVLLALDHAIGGSRVTSRLEQLVQSIIDRPLPVRTNEDWFHLAHRALVNQLAESLADSNSTELNALEQELARVYSARWGDQSILLPKPISAIHSIAHRYRQMLYDLRSKDFDSAGNAEQVDLIEARFAVRYARASSPLRKFFAYQRAICELHAHRIESSLPGASFPVQDLFTEFETRLAETQTVLEQIVQTERFIAQLWGIWFEGGSL